MKNIVKLALLLAVGLLAGCNNSSADPLLNGQDAAKAAEMKAATTSLVALVKANPDLGAKPLNSLGVDGSAGGSGAAAQLNMSLNNLTVVSGNVSSQVLTEAKDLVGKIIDNIDPKAAFSFVVKTEAFEQKHKDQQKEAGLGEGRGQPGRGQKREPNSKEKLEERPGEGQRGPAEEQHSCEEIMIDPVGTLGGGRTEKELMDDFDKQKKEFKKLVPTCTMDIKNFASCMDDTSRLVTAVNDAVTGCDTPEDEVKKAITNEFGGRSIGEVMAKFYECGQDLMTSCGLGGDKGSKNPGGKGGGQPEDGEGQPEKPAAGGAGGK